MRQGTSVTSPGLVRFVLNAALDPSNELHASCHQQILRRLDSNPNILEEDAEHQALLLQSFAGSVGALSEEKRLCIIRAVRYAIPFWSHTPPCQVQRMRAVVWTPLKALSLIDVWTDRCPASLSIQAVESVATFLSHLAFISPARFYGCSLLRLVRLHLAMVSASGCRLIKETGETFHGPSPGVSDYVHSNCHKKASVVKQTGSALLKGVPLGLREATAVMTRCLNGLRGGAINTFSDLTARNVPDATGCDLWKPQRASSSAAFVPNVQLSTESSESEPSATSRFGAKEDRMGPWEVDPDRLHLSLSALASWGDEDPSLQAPILGVLTERVVELECHIAAGEQEGLQHTIRVGGEANGWARGLPEWAEPAAERVKSMEAELPGVVLSVEEFGRLLYGSASGRKGESGGAVGLGGCGMELASWWAVALACGRRWCGEKKGVDGEGSGGKQEGVAEQGPVGLPGGGVKVEEEQYERERGTLGEGKRKRGNEEVTEPQKRKRSILNPRFYRQRACSALISAFEGGVRLQGLLASQTLLLSGLAAHTGSVLSREVVRNWILAGVRDPQTPLSTCHLALQLTGALLGVSPDQSTGAAADQAVGIGVGGGLEGGGETESKKIGRNGSRENDVGMGSGHRGWLLDRKRVRCWKLYRKVWRAVRRRVGEGGGRKSGSREGGEGEELRGWEGGVQKGGGDGSHNHGLEFENPEEGETPGVKDGNPGVKEETPGVEDETPGVEEENPRVEEETPGAEEESPGVENENPGVEDENAAVCFQTRSWLAEGVSQPRSSLSGLRDDDAVRIGELPWEGGGVEGGGGMAGGRELRRSRRLRWRVEEERAGGEDVQDSGGGESDDLGAGSRVAGEDKEVQTPGERLGSGECGEVEEKNEKEEEEEEEKEVFETNVPEAVGALSGVRGEEGLWRDWGNLGEDLLTLVLKGRGSRTLLAVAGVCRRWRETAVGDELWGPAYARRFKGLPKERPHHYKLHRQGMPWMVAFFQRLLFRRKSLTCDFCGMSYSKTATASFERHRRGHVARTPLPLLLECPIEGCKKRYSQAKYLKRHLRAGATKSGHSLADIGPYTCRMCPKVVGRRDEMAQHRWLHGGGGGRLGS